MQAASKATYLSKKQIYAFTQKRQKLADKKNKLFKKDRKEGTDMIQPKTGETVKKEDEEMKDEMDSSSGSDSEKDQRYRSCEELDSDELDGDLNLSDSEGEALSFRRKNKEQKASRRRPARQYRQEIDTNIFKIGFQTLKDKAELATGDMTYCSKCGAIFNMNSKTEERKSLDGEPQQIWCCEFCNHENEVDIEPEEKPKGNAVNYIVEAAAQVEDKKAMGKQEISVVFCIDQSGSMCVSQPIQGKHKIKGDKTKELAQFKKFGDGSDQFMQGERNVTYVSRMQCLQAAIDQQITDMSNGAADRKIGLVSFNHEVTVVGDGTQDPQTITGDKLMDYDYLMENGKK